MSLNRIILITVSTIAKELKLFQTVAQIKHRSQAQNRFRVSCVLMLSAW